MKWFIVVVMTTQLNAVGKEETPLWIPYLEFGNYEECMTFARNNQMGASMRMPPGKPLLSYDRCRAFLD